MLLLKETKIFKQSDLVLKVSRVYDTSKLNIQEWDPYIDYLCGNRIYQKEAIINSIIYLASGKYKDLTQLAKENFDNNLCLKEKYSNFEDLLKNIQFKDKLYADIDLATGSGKSYVIYGIAQIALGIGLVDRVLVLCPSLTIESELKDKFISLSSDEQLKKLIPETAIIKNPSIISADQTVKKGDLCVENIHAVYENTGSSIDDSFNGTGSNTLVLNDESHHIFNKTGDIGQIGKAIKKWKSFLIDKKHNFKYMLGFTGTAYIEDDYFNDVIYRYSLKQAIEDMVVKNVDYVKEDESHNDNERFQKIYKNHTDNKMIYSLVKPISIIVTKDIGNAKNLYDDFVEFIANEQNIDKKSAESKVLIVTSSSEHKSNIVKLKYVDLKDNPIEWIISVSMLTEGWDVKNVFQIVPWVDRAFNSKLLISQVLGRGLRVPDEYKIPQSKVTVFNHSSWSSKIKKLVDEVLEIEARINSVVINTGEREKYHFEVKNINYDTKKSEIDKETDSFKFDFSRLLEEGIVLESQSVIVEKGTIYESVYGGKALEKNYAIKNITYTIDEVIDKLFEEFEIREWEGKTLKLGDNEYTKNDLPPREVIEKIIRLSMQKRGNKGEEIIESNRNKILNAFTPLLRKKSKKVISKIIEKNTFSISTKQLAKQSTSVSMLKQDRSVFITNNWESEVEDEEQTEILNGILADDNLPRYAVIDNIDYCIFKTPVTCVLTSSKPEREFVKMLYKKENADLISKWIKSRDRNFYEIEYSCKVGTGKSRKYKHKQFNPDFFLLVEKNNEKYFLVIEIKDDKDDSDENKAKYRAAIRHFSILNSRLESSNEKEHYIFHFLSPKDYPTFFDHLKDGSVLESQDSFRCELELLLEQNDE